MCNVYQNEGKCYRHDIRPLSQIKNNNNHTTKLHGLKRLEKFGDVFLNFASQSQLTNVFSE